MFAVRSRRNSADRISDLSKQFSNLILLVYSIRSVGRLTGKTSLTGLRGETPFELGRRSIFQSQLHVSQFLRIVARLGMAHKRGQDSCSDWNEVSSHRSGLGRYCKSVFETAHKLIAALWSRTFWFTSSSSLMKPSLS